MAREVAALRWLASVLTTLAIALPRGSNEAYGQSGSRTDPLAAGILCIDNLNAIDAAQDAIDATGRRFHVTYSSAHKTPRDTDMLF